jgi:hypothetical protein
VCLWQISLETVLLIFFASACSMSWRNPLINWLNKVICRILKDGKMRNKTDMALTIAVHEVTRKWCQQSDV